MRVEPDVPICALVFARIGAARRLTLGGLMGGYPRQWGQLKRWFVICLVCPVVGVIALVSVGAIRQIVPTPFVPGVMVAILSSLVVLFFYALIRGILFRCPRCENLYCYPDPHWFGRTAFNSIKACVHCGLKWNEGA